MPQADPELVAVKELLLKVWLKELFDFQREGTRVKMLHHIQIRNPDSGLGKRKREREREAMSQLEIFMSGNFKQNLCATFFLMPYYNQSRFKKSI